MVGGAAVNPHIRRCSCSRCGAECWNVLIIGRLAVCLSCFLAVCLAASRRGKRGAVSAEDVAQAQTLRIYAEVVGTPYPAKPEVEHVLALAARLQEAEREVEHLRQVCGITATSTSAGVLTLIRRAEAAEAREAALREALKQIARRDSRTRPANGTWEPITADADMRTIARAALAADPESEEAPE